MESDVHHKPEIKEFKSSELERLVPAQNEVLLPCYHVSRCCKAGMLVFLRHVADQQEQAASFHVSNEPAPAAWCRACSQSDQWPCSYLCLVPTETKVLAAELRSRFPGRVELLLSRSN